MTEKNENQLETSNGNDNASSLSNGPISSPNIIPKYLLTSLKKDRSVNPTDWDAKLEFWSNRIKSNFKSSLIASKENIRSFCQYENDSESNNKLINSGQKRFYSDWERILGELEKRVTILPIDEFEKNYDEFKKESFGSWLLYRVGWFGDSSTAQSNNLTKLYINMDLLKEICIQWIDDVYENATSSIDLIFSPSQISNYLLKDKFSNVLKNDTEVNHIVNFMHQEGPATIIYMSDNRKGLLFSDDSTNRGVEKITSSHLGIAQIKETLYRIEKQIEELTTRISDSTNLIRNLIKQQNKGKARFELGRKRMFENVLERRRASYQNLEEILTAIQSAQTEKQIFEALKSGTNSLKALTDDMGDVEDSLDKMADALADYRAIQEILDSNYMDNTQLDDSEILENLKRLTMEDEESNKQKHDKKVEQSNPSEVKRANESKSIANSTENLTTNSTASTISLDTFPDIKSIPSSITLIEYMLKRFEGINIESETEKIKEYYKNLTLRLKLVKMQEKKRKRQPEGVDKLQETINSYSALVSKFEEQNNEEAAVQYKQYISLLQQEINETLNKKEQTESIHNQKKVANYPTPSKNEMELA